MNSKGFQALVSQLGDLSAVQCDALITALTRKLPIDDAVLLIDTKFHTDPTCGHCHSKDVRGWSSQGGLKRYRCKACSKTFNALTGTPLAYLHRRDAWFAYAQALADGLSLRKWGKPLPAECGGTAFPLLKEGCRATTPHRHLIAVANDGTPTPAILCVTTVCSDGRSSDSP